MQRGQVFRRNGSWYVRHYQNELKEGKLVRRRVCERLARYCDDYRSKKDVLPLVDEILFPVNSGSAQPESSLKLAEFVEKRFFPAREKKLRPSTLKGYRDIFKNRIERSVGEIHDETQVAMKKLERAVGKEWARIKRRSVSKLKKTQVRAHSSVG